MGVIGRYETHEQIGTGAMGVVYRARDIVLDRFVALKVLRTGPDLDPELKERFYREARFGAKLQHPNIAIVYDLGEANGVPYIAMELLTGADLRKHIEEKRPLPLAQKLEILAQVCDGVAHAHSQGIIHRDIKPSNIFIHEDRQAKVLDFGIARLPTSTLTVAGNVLGTPNYMSPEQILSRPCDARSDVFSSAIVFYEFLVYAHPFKSTFIPRRIAEDAPDSLYDHDPLIPPALEELIQKALAKRPEDRISSAEELAVGLRRVLDMLRSGLAPHSLPMPAAQTAEELSREAPSADDSRARRVAEFIGLVNEFDQSVAERRLPAARATLQQMRELAEVDPSLGRSIHEYEKQLSELTPTEAQPSEQQQNEQTTLIADTVLSSHFPVEGFDYHGEGTGGPAAPETPEAMPSDWTVYRPETDYRVEHGEGSEYAKPEPLPYPGAPVADQSAEQPTSQQPSTRLKPAHVALIAVAAGLLIVLLALAFHRKARPEPHVAQARVLPAHAALLQAPRFASKRLQVLDSGMTVNVLHAASSTDSWVQIQYVSPDGGRVSEPGYVQASQLGSWSSNNPKTVWDYLQLSRPADNASAAEVNAYTEEVHRFARTAPAFQDRANLERAQLYAELARKMKDDGKPAGELTARQQAHAALALLSGNLTPAESSEKARMEQELDQSEPATPPVAASDAGVAPPVDAQSHDEEIKALLKGIRRDFDNGAYEHGLAAVQEVLALDPANADAVRWRAKIKDAQEVERKYR